MLSCTATNLDRASSGYGAIRFVDAAGVPPNIASVPMGQVIPKRQPDPAQIMLGKYEYAHADGLMPDKPHANLSACHAERQKAELAAQ